MKPLSEVDIKLQLSGLFWDIEIDPDKLYDLLNGKIQQVGHVDASNLFYRILTTLDWYSIIRVVPHERMKELLSDTVLDRIRFKDLKDKYLYARQNILH